MFLSACRIHWCAKVVALLLAVAACCGLANAAEAPGIAGYWLGHIEGDTRERILVVAPSDPAADKPSVRIRYGYPDGKLNFVDGATLTATAEDAYTLNFTSGSGSAIEVRYTGKEAERMTGALVGKGGAKKELTFLRVATPVPLKRDELVGHWLLHVEGQDRDRILQIDAATPGDGKTVLTAKYGYADAKLAPISDAFVTDEGDLPRLHLSTPAAGAVEARYITVSDGFFVGSLRSAKGSQSPLRLTRIDLDAYREATASNLLSRFRMTRDSVIDVIYVGAPDCPFCMDWRFQNLYTGHHGFRDSPEWNAVGMTLAEKTSYITRLIPASPFPDRLKEVCDQLNANRKYHIVTSVTPAFVVVIDQKVAKWGVGKQWQTDVYPFIQQAVAARRKLQDNPG